MKHTLLNENKYRKQLNANKIRLGYELTLYMTRNSPANYVASNQVEY